MKKTTIILLILALFTLTLTSTTVAEEKITVSSKAFTEQLILGNMTTILLENNGFPVENKIGVGATSLLRPALKEGSIDIYWEYTGTLLTVVMEEEEINIPEKAYKKVKEWDLENNSIVWLDYAPANNTYGIMVRKDWASETGIKSISDLAKYVNNHPGRIRFATDVEFYERPDGLSTVEEKYDFKFGESNLTFLEIGLTYNALKNSNVDAAMGFGTDGRIKAFDLLILKDDKSVFPVYNPAPTVRREILEQYSGIKKPLKELAELLDTGTLRHLNQRVDVNKETPEDVARNFLRENGLIK